MVFEQRVVPVTPSKRLWDTLYKYFVLPVRAVGKQYGISEDQMRNVDLDAMVTDAIEEKEEKAKGQPSAPTEIQMDAEETELLVLNPVKPEIFEERKISYGSIITIDRVAMGDSFRVV